MKQSKLSRRNFLIAAGVGGAAASALVTQSVNPEQPKPVASNDKRSGKGYQDSAHVRSYYNTAKV